MHLNIEETIAKELKSSIYIDSYLLGAYKHSESGHIEVLIFNSSCPDLDRQESPFVRYHILVAYFGTILYKDSNVVDRQHQNSHTIKEVAQKAVNYLRHRADKVQEQIINL